MIAQPAGNATNINSSHGSSSSNCSDTQHNIDNARLAGIKYNVDIGLKVSTKKFHNHNCPLHGKSKCINQAKSNISKCAYISTVMLSRFLGQPHTNCNISKLY